MVQNQEAVPGDLEADYINTHIHSSPILPLSQSSTTVNLLSSTTAPARLNVNGTSDYSFSIAKHPFSTTVPSFLKIYSSPPHLPPGLINPSEDEYLSDCGNADAEDTDMDVEETNSVDTAKWESLKKNIWNEIREEQDELLREAKEKEQQRLRATGRAGYKSKEVARADIRKTYIAETGGKPTEQQMENMYLIYSRYFLEHQPQFKPSYTATTSATIDPTLLTAVPHSIPNNSPEPSTTPELQC